MQLLLNNVFEEEDSIMSQRYLTWLWVIAAADECHLGDGMVRSAERPQRNKTGVSG
jgi:hypothetical protein